MFRIKRIPVLLIVILGTIFLFFLKTDTSAQSLDISPDAIAIRVIPNPNHYSASRWYKLQKFNGSAQATEVDGYTAVRDGRTVYVNAANIDGSSLFTNIYVISYNQEAERVTKDMLGQILMHWKFNNNLLATGVCSQDAGKDCLLDTDCDTGYCDSEKARVIRDTKRLEAIAEITDALEDYKEDKGKYPTMESGSYLVNTTLSTWPSWQKQLANDLGKRLPVDPINKLGECSDYDPITCWNENTKSFADADPSDTNLDLPADSHVLVYVASSSGHIYDLCGIMESGYVGGAGSCGSAGSYAIGGTTVNNPPQFLGQNLDGLTGHEYKGYISATDPDGDAITWSINTSASSWVPNHWSAAPILRPSPTFNQKELYAAITGFPGNYSLTLTIDDGRGEANSTLIRTFNVSVINPPPSFYVPDYTYSVSSTDPLVYSFTASDDPSNYPLSYSYTSGVLPPGITDSFTLSGTIYNFSLNGFVTPPVIADTAYPLNIRIQDVFGSSDNRTLNLLLVNHSPRNFPPSIEYLASTTNPISYSVNHNDVEHNYPLTHAILAGILPDGLSDNFNYNNNTYTYTISGTINPSTNPIPVNTIYSFDTRVTDEYGAFTNASFTITVNNNPPIMDAFNCDTVVRINNTYDPCTVTAQDPGNNAIASFDYLGLPPGMGGDSSTGVISGVPSVAGSYAVQVRAIDEYGAVGNWSTYNLFVNTYCQDGAVQSPNMEGGNEECDDGNNLDTDACANDCSWTCEAFSGIMFNTLGAADAMWYDDNASPYVSANVPGGTYLKLSTSMPTPYIWVANSNYAGCTTGVNCDMISKIRTFDGCHRDASGWDCGIWETQGQLLGAYNVGTDPSRTAVNVETGDVWVANRGSANITKLNINGTHRKTCFTGGGPRGVAIEENGDVWVANLTDGTVVKLLGNDTNCTIQATVNVGGMPYGLAIDSNNNVWVSNRGTCMIQRIDTATLAVTNYPLPGSNICTNGGVASCGDAGRNTYGITVDLDDNIWAADTCTGVYKLTQSTGAVSLHSFAGLAHGFGRSRGVSIDTNGSIWIAMDYSNQVVKINNPNNPAAYTIHNSSGGFPVGIVGDSVGNVWTVNQAGDNTSVFNTAGMIVGTHLIRPAGIDPFAYTYSDMTGLNRAMIMRSGNWISNTAGVFDSGNTVQHWGEVDWLDAIPTAMQSLEIYLRADDADPDTRTWMDSSTWNSLPLDQREGRFLQIRVDMRSRQRGVTPVLWNLSMLCS